MDPEHFRKYGHQVIDWVADYLEQVESYPVLSKAAPGDILGQLPPEPPLSGESMSEILQDLSLIHI